MPKRKQTKHTRTPIETLLITGAVIMFWRGIWGLLDIYFFPDHPVISYSVTLGVSIILFIFVIRKHVRHLL